jgi:hypothetical protein
LVIGAELFGGVDVDINLDAGSQGRLVLITITELALISNRSGIGALQQILAQHQADIVFAHGDACPFGA